MVSWKPPSEKNCNGSITGYVIQCAREGTIGSDDTMITNVSNVTTYKILGLYANVDYSVTVAAVNTNGTGPFSKPLVARSGEDSKLSKLHACILLCFIHMHVCHDAKF